MSPLAEEPVETARQLLGHADAALSRAKLLQLASNPNDAARPRDRLAMLQRDDVVEAMGKAARADVERRFTWSATGRAMLEAWCA